MLSTDTISQTIHATGKSRLACEQFIDNEATSGENEAGGLHSASLPNAGSTALPNKESALGSWGNF
ncbi:hypothetical protein MAR_033586 [Mya arenaria]|uniref:Uncharacterized protein n=1 Tax=Mya arenaria TaxID=6604 RepID=A0ABY7GCI2_MYAAR|nr:hypothetical protein MAR_033586 [Mya arenaria]